MMKLKAGFTGGMMTVSMDALVQVNPVIQPMVIYSGSFNDTCSQVVGSSQLRNVRILVGNERHRFELCSQKGGVLC
ncbi:MAG: hypothetical protein HP492_14105 [Nitrospira sp.]|nr:hypothetical protein [Nitrospira sp.]